MDKVKPNSEPETLDAPSTFGGRRPSSCSALIGLNYFALGWCLAFAIAGQSVLVAIVGMLNIPVIVRAYMHEQNVSDQ
jgi:hypothetical protein